jgi:hypothetical protein
MRKREKTDRRKEAKGEEKEGEKEIGGRVKRIMRTKNRE